MNITMNDVTIYTTQYCPYCIRAKQLLNAKNIPYEEIDVGGDRALRQKMEQLSGGYTVPQIFINTQPIGGCDELYQLENSHQLDALLQS